MEISIDITPVNEHAPVFSSAEYSANIAEDVSVGTSILRVSAVDQDDGLQGTMNEQKAFHGSKWPALSSNYFGLLFYIKQFLETRYSLNTTKIYPKEETKPITK